MTDTQRLLDSARDGDPEAAHALLTQAQRTDDTAILARIITLAQHQGDDALLLAAIRALAQDPEVEALPWPPVPELPLLFPCWIRPELTGEAAMALWKRLDAHAESTGLSPILIGLDHTDFVDGLMYAHVPTSEHDPFAAVKRGFESELDAIRADLGHTAPLERLAERERSWALDDHPDRIYCSDFPRHRAATLDDALTQASHAPSHLLLAACDPITLSAHLDGDAAHLWPRWSKRFGARLVRIGANTAAITVAHPPRTFDALTAVALDHVALNNEEEGMLRHALWRLRDNHLWWRVYY